MPPGKLIAATVGEEPSPLDAAAPVPMYVVMTWHAGMATPGAHAVQALAPAAEEYIPKAQVVHTAEVTAANKLP